MTKRYQAVVMLQIETDDPRLLPEAVAKTMGTAKGVQATRDLIMAQMPGSITRVIGLFGVEHARLLMMLHEAYGESLGDSPFIRPPPGYVPPTRE